MKQLRKFWDLGWTEQREFVHAVALLIVFEAGLRWLSFPGLVAWAHQSGKQIRRNDVAPERLACLVEAAAGFWTRWTGLQMTCLRKSLALCRILRRHGREARLVIGATLPLREFQAHAWVELDGALVGRPAAAEYRELAVFGSPNARRQAA